ncbi:HWE histidine kinase domain-containing protein [Salinarimonas sp.]|uniref:HWE histidine kinase domain-containing protein n=1 Tax=Salinarimonas sp. TaxID=2766526 RepID=UPI00391ADD3D
MTDPGDVPRFGEADLTDCDREPIHVPGSIQPHGCLLAVDPTSGALLQRAGDLARILGREPVPGDDLAALVGGETAARLLAKIPELAARTAPQTTWETGLPGPAGPLDARVHLAEAGLVVELEPAARPGSGLGDLLLRVQAMLAALSGREELSDYLSACADEVRALTGFDRVMVYRFLEDGSGTVVAEAKAPEMESYLGLRYPESDIPKQARALYLKSWTRAIPDIGYVPSPLVPPTSPRTGAPLDLGSAGLRSVSPLHVRYLRNMGVAASMSISIVHRGTLWGLIACHHRTPHHVPLEVLGACELFGQVFSLQLESRLHAMVYEERLRKRRIVEHILSRLSREESLAEGLAHAHPSLVDLVAADGVAICVDGGFAAHGDTPDRAGVERLVAALNAREVGSIFATDRLGALLGEDAAAMGGLAGLVALSVSRTPKDWIFWFRREVVETVTWAGDPDKAVRSGADGGLTPRASFAAWRETVRGRCPPWRDVEIEAAGALRLAILEIVVRRLDEIARERAKAESHQRLLVAELDHRVKNTLANIQALMRHTRRSQATLASYVESLELRIKAMAHAQSLLSESRWRGADLRRLVEEELGRFGHEAISIEGPRLELDARATLCVGMLVHELATNAGRHGALSVPDGRVEVSWRLGEDGLAIDWRETGGPPVAPPQRRGFGRVLIESSLGYELDGTSALAFRPEGVACAVTIPRRHVLAAPAAEEEPAATGTPRAPMGAKVLLVEDSLLTALDVSESLDNLGYQVLGPAARVADALRIVERDRPHVAVLDINLGDEDSFPIADRLVRENIPFVFLTGYDAQSILPERFRDVPCIAKPFSDRLLAASLARLVAERR